MEIIRNIANKEIVFLRLENRKVIIHNNITDSAIKNKNVCSIIESTDK